MTTRERPNILVTGTPGVGKTTFCESLTQIPELSIRHIEVSHLIREKKLYKEWDDEMDCSIFDEDMVGDELEPLLESGGYLVDFHSAGFVDSSWFDLVVVLRADTSVLWGRLEKRHYSETKVKQNVEAEIFQTCLEEVHEAFEGSPVPVWELTHDNQEQLESAIARISEFIRAFPGEDGLM